MPGTKVSIGPPITEHAEPIMLRGGILTVNVADSAWLTELTFLKKDILERINRGLLKPAVRDLRMKLGSVTRKREEKAKPARDGDHLIDGDLVALGVHSVAQTVVVQQNFPASEIHRAALVVEAARGSKRPEAISAASISPVRNAAAVMMSRLPA